MSLWGPDDTDTSGFAGAGDMVDDGMGGQRWVPRTPGTTLNSRPITTPNSSTGQPAYADPSAPDTQFATPRGGPLTTTPNSSTGASAPGVRTYLPNQAPENYVPRPGGAPAAGGGLGSAIGIGSQAIMPASTLLQGVVSGNKGAQEILRQAHPDWSDQDMKDWAARQLGGGYPQSTTYPQTQPGPGPSAAPPMFPPMPPSGGPSTGGTAQMFPPPPTVIPPFTVSPTVHPNDSVPYPPPRPRRSGAGGGRSGGGGGSAASPAAPPSSPGEYFATTGNARSGVFTPGGFAQNSPHFYTPVSGPDLRFGPGQWSPGPPQQSGNARGGGGYDVNGMFANLPNNTFNSAGGRGGGGGGIPRTARAQVPQQAPGPEDPSITARGGVPSGPYAGTLPGQPGVDPSIVARQKLAAMHPGGLAASFPFANLYGGS
jgi:hypothetical protein